MVELMREGCRRHCCEVVSGLERNELEAPLLETMIIRPMSASYAVRT